MALCPICQKHGKPASLRTISNLINDSEKNLLHWDQQYFLCLSSTCHAAYFNAAQVIDKDKLLVDIWYKTDASPKIICYCNNVTDAEIINAVKAGARTLLEVQDLTGANTGGQCLTKNPSGT